MAKIAGDRSKWFWEKVDVRGPTECWEWTAKARSGLGYGTFNVGDGKMEYAHRISYELANGEIPEGLLVRHKCDNRLCCNPAHLELGTHKQNTGDAIERNRLASGSRHGMAKLTEEDIPQIREMLANGLTQREIGEKFGVTSSMIGCIARGQNWRGANG